ncbi:hypothetical protein FISHEDRAFT_78942 [Fistulina hepatica ATCC 64428]|uniref:Uncharacterized protein n=1 Tax=Fistulina hepatica ATCC 64428 TaxID=1128425 RepID=A0A0D6ZZK2_9AGAR|nr:hypothetical protein FISHEDRAFT_78942 [Fistulina hepatica ATCC 64428]
MSKCLRLSNLPPVTARYKSVTFRHTPGSINNFVAHIANPGASLDSHHPAWKTKRAQSQFPTFRGPGFYLRLLPTGMLDKPAPEKIWDEPLTRLRSYETWSERVARLVAAPLPHITPLWNPAPDGEEHIRMCLQSIRTKKKLGKSAVIRHQVIGKLKNAINLIVVRAAEAKEVDGRLCLVYDESESKYIERWILPNWTYIFAIEMQMCRMPLAQLVQSLRPVLRSSWDRCIAIEHQWLSRDPQVQNADKPLIPLNEILPNMSARSLPPQQSRRSSAQQSPRQSQPQKPTQSEKTSSLDQPQKRPSPTTGESPSPSSTGTPKPVDLHSFLSELEGDDEELDDFLKNISVDDEFRDGYIGTGSRADALMLPQRGESFKPLREPGQQEPYSMIFRDDIVIMDPPKPRRDPEAEAANKPDGWESLRKAMNLTKRKTRFPEQKAAKEQQYTGLGSERLQSPAGARLRPSRFTDERSFDNKRR